MKINYVLILSSNKLARFQVLIGYKSKYFKMKGINFVTNDKNRPIAVQINLLQNKEIWEDFHALMVAEERRNESSRSYHDIRKENL